jgi:hypothetical protein
VVVAWFESEFLAEGSELVLFQVGDSHPAPPLGAADEVAKTSFIADRSSKSRGMTLVRPPFFLEGLLDVHRVPVPDERAC